MSPDERTAPGVADADGNGAHEREESDPLGELVALLAARFELLVTSVKTLLSVHKDRAQLAVRRRIQAAILGAVAAVAGATVVVYATIHLVRGTAQGLAVLFEGREWAGSLGAGLLFLLLTGGGLLLALRRWDKQQLEKARERYAQLEREGIEALGAAEEAGDG